MGVLKDGDISVRRGRGRSSNVRGGRALPRCSNAGAAQVYVFDRLYRTSVTGFRTVDPDYAWHWLEADGRVPGGEVCAASAGGTKVESPEVAYARVLAAGAVLEGRVLLPGRLDQDLPYGVTPPLAAVDADQIHRVFGGLCRG